MDLREAKELRAPRQVRDEGHTRFIEALAEPCADAVMRQFAASGASKLDRTQSGVSHILKAGASTAPSLLGSSAHGQEHLLCQR